MVDYRKTIADKRRQWLDYRPWRINQSRHSHSRISTKKNRSGGSSPKDTLREAVRICLTMGYIRETTFPLAWCLLDAKIARMKCAGFLVDLNPRRTPSPSENWHSICAGVCNCALWGPSHRRFIIKHVCVEKQEPYWAKLLTMVGDQWVTTVSTAMNLTAHGSWSSPPFPVFNHWTKQDPSLPCRRC